MANVQIDRTRRTDESRDKEVRQQSWKPAHDLRSEEHTSELQSH